MHHFYEKIKRAQEGDEEQLLMLIQDFTPLLVNQGYRTGLEDGYYELRLFFIELIRKIPIENFLETQESKIVSYIQKSVSNHASEIYRRLSLKKPKNEELQDTGVSEDGGALRIEIEDLLSKLTPRQYKFIRKRFWEQKSDQEIADETGVSRQAVHQAIRRALKCLRAEIDG